MTTSNSAKPAPATQAPGTAAKKPTQTAAGATKAAGPAKPAQTPQKAAQPTTATHTKDAGMETPTGVVRFYRLRKTGTARYMAVLAAGSTERAEAKKVAARLHKGESVAAIAKDLGTSVSTVRRHVAALAFTLRVEPGEFDHLIAEADNGRVVFPAGMKVDA